MTYEIMLDICCILLLRLMIDNVSLLVGLYDHQRDRMD